MIRASDVQAARTSTIATVSVASGFPSEFLAESGTFYFEPVVRPQRWKFLERRHAIRKAVSTRAANEVRNLSSCPRGRPKIAMRHVGQTVIRPATSLALLFVGRRIEPVRPELGDTAIGGDDHRVPTRCVVRYEGMTAAAHEIQIQDRRCPGTSGIVSRRGHQSAIADSGRSPSASRDQGNPGHREQRTAFGATRPCRHGPDAGRGR